MLIAYLALAGLVVAAAAPEPPVMPLQFTATVEVTAHLVDRTQDYPPWLRVVRVSYDFVNRRALAVVEQGHDEGKTFLRRYDNKTEYMVRGGAYAECQRAYLGETMPAPALPRALTFEGLETVEGVPCEHWMEDLGTNRLHFYFEAAAPRLPRRVTDEQVRLRAMHEWVCRTCSGVRCTRGGPWFRVRMIH
jgi:hypothetical protein